MEDGRWVQVGLSQLGVPNANLDPTATQLEQREELQTLTPLRTSLNPEVVSTSNSKQQTGAIYQQEHLETRSQFPFNVNRGDGKVEQNGSNEKASINDHAVQNTINVG